MFQENFLQAMSRAANTVSVVTTDGEAGRAGVTVSAMCSVSAEPPSLLVCIHHLSPAAATIAGNGTFCVNVLRNDQSHISDSFAGRLKVPGGDKFNCAKWQKLANGSPALDDAFASFDCTVISRHRSGTHEIFIGQVVDVELGDDLPEGASALVHANREYGRLAPLHVPDEAMLANAGWG